MVGSSWYVPLSVFLTTWILTLVLVGSPKQKYIKRYTVSPYAQKPLEGALNNAIFNTYRRVKAQALFVIIPVVSMYYIIERANNYNEYLYTKAGREELARVNV